MMIKVAAADGSLSAEQQESIDGVRSAPVKEEKGDAIWA
jgi:hypothetical protein